MRYLFDHFASSVLKGCIMAVVLIVLALFGVSRLGYILHVVYDDTPSDVIVVLSGGGYERVDQGIELFRRGVSDRLLFTGAAFDGTTSNAQTMLDRALDLGVDASHIILEEHANNTWQNALLSYQLFDTPPASLTLVTSDYHQKRASLIFAHVYTDTIIYNAPADSGFWSVYDWWTDTSALHLTLSEVIKITWGSMTGIWG